MTPADRAKAEKLFRMLQSPNENERSVANRKLIELLAKYNMTISDLIAQGLDGGMPQSPKASTQSSAPRPPPPPPRPPPISIPQHHIELLVEYLVAGFETDWGIDLRPNMIAMGRLKQAAEEAIYKLLSATSTRIHLPFIACNKMGAPMDFTYRLTQAEFQKLITNPPPPKSPPPRPPPPPLQNRWQPRTLTKAHKVALTFLAFFFLGVPGLYGLGAILNGEPEFGGGVILMVSGITWAIWKFGLSKVAEGFVGGGVALIGLMMSINHQDQQPIHQGKPPPKPAAEISVSIVNGLQVISLTGEIGPNDYERFKQRSDMLTAKKVVLLSGPGGAASGTYAIGSYIRAKRLATFVSGFCANACAYIWLAGSPRFMAPNASIGFHSASDGNGRDSNTGNAVLGAYMNELGLSVNVIAWASTAGPDDIAYLRPQTARQLGIDITVLPDLQSVALALESRSGR